MIFHLVCAGNPFQAREDNMDCWRFSPRALWRRCKVSYHRHYFDFEIFSCRYVVTARLCYAIEQKKRDSL